MNGFRRIAQAFAAVVLLVCLTVQANAQERVTAPLLDQVSDRAQVVVVVPSLTKLSDRLATLEAALQLGTPELADALGQFKTVSGMTQGLRDDGAMLLILEDVGAAFAGGEPRTFLLVPVRDFEAFLGNFKVQDQAGAAVAELQLDTGHAGFARKLEGYALLGPSRELVEAYQPAAKSATWLKKVGPLGGQYLDSSDLAVVVDVESLSMTLMGLSGMIQMFSEMGLANAPAQEQAAARAGTQWFTQGFGSVVRDGAGLVIGADVTDAGIGLSFAMQFKDDSELARRFTQGGDAAAHLARLPDKPWLFAFSMNAEAVGFAHLVEGLVPMIEARNAAMAENFRILLPNLKTMRGMSALAMAPAAGESQAASVVYINTADAAGFKQGFADYLKSMDGKTATGSDQPMSTTYNANRLKIGDVSVDQYNHRLGAELSESAYVAAQGEHFLQVTPPDMRLLTDALKAMEANQGLGAAGAIRQTRESLSPSPALELYINVPMMLAQAMQQAQPGPGFNRAAPQAGPAQPPAAASAAALSVSVSHGGVVVRQFIPMEVARTVQAFAPMLQGLVPADPQAAPF